MQFYIKIFIDNILTIQVHNSMKNMTISWWNKNINFFVQCIHIVRTYLHYHEHIISVYLIKN